VFFRGEDAQVWLVGLSLHSDIEPEATGGGAFALTLSGLSQQVGMPIPRGGAQAIPDALRAYLEALGCPVLTNQEARQIVVRDGRAVAVRTATDEFVARRAVLATVEPKSLFLDLVGAGHLPSDFVRLVHRFRRGTATFKLDVALGERPRFRAPGLQDTGVFHLADSIETLSANVNQAEVGLLPEHPLIIGGIHTLADPTRAPAGQHTLWMETHVPYGIRGDGGGTIQATGWAEAREPFAERFLAELERYAPGVRAAVLAYHAQSPEDLEASNANLACGDIATGSYYLDQQLVFRPMPGWFQYRTPVKGLYMSGAANHPGGAVHGAPGSHAAGILLADLRLHDARETVASGLEILTAPLRRLAR
jgi:phytoene dehydrogenase-like protein